MKKIIVSSDTKRCGNVTATQQTMNLLNNLTLVISGSFGEEVSDGGINIYSYPSSSWDPRMWEHQVNWVLSQNL